MKHSEDLISKIINLSKIRFPEDMESDEWDNMSSLVISSRNNILIKFGLPVITDNWAKLIFSKEISRDKATTVYNELKQLAEDFLLSKTKTNIEILYEAKKLNKCATQVFPLMGIDLNL